MKETRRIHGKNTRSGAPGRVKRWLIGAEGWLSARSWRYLAGPLVAVLCVLVLIMPSAYVVQVPGPTPSGTIKGFAPRPRLRAVFYFCVLRVDLP